MALSSSRECAVTSLSLSLSPPYSLTPRLLMIIEVTCDRGQIALIEMPRTSVRAEQPPSPSHLKRPTDPDQSRLCFTFTPNFSLILSPDHFSPNYCLIVAEVRPLHCSRNGPLMCFSTLSKCGTITRLPECFHITFLLSKRVWMEVRNYGRDGKMSFRSENNRI